MSQVTAAGARVCDGYAVPLRLRAGAPSAALVFVCVFAWACSLPDKSPTEPQPAPSVAPTPTAGTGGSPTPPPVLGGPPPKESPSPSPGSGPSPSPSPTPDSGTGEGALDCGSPLPPPLSKFKVKVHLRGSKAWTLDSTPLVGPDPDYCRAIGFTDGRSFCPVRPEGNPERAACEAYVTGIATDTGRPGPTWTFDGHFCTGPASGCANSPDNQYQLLVYQGGTFQACATSGVCGEVFADR